MLLAVGTVLGEKYRVVRPIGRGGMGAVYEAEQLDLGRRVALKVLFETDERAVQRLRQEALAAAAIRSPHVAVVLDFQARPREPAFLVMELLEGEPLSAVLAREGRLVPERAVRIAASVLSALDEAHRAGIVHRDVKPSNVWLARTAVDELAKLLDFGIVKQADGVKTTTGSVLGTPPYLSPEQLLGSPIDPRSDLHAVGVVLFEMLSGERPWRRDQLTQDIVLRPAPVELLPPDVPPGVAAVVRRALEKKPSDRFATAREMLEALTRPAVHLAPVVPTPVSGIPSRPPPSSMLPGESRPPRARKKRSGGARVFLLATGAALVVGAAGIGGALVAKGRAARHRAPTVASAPVVPVEDAAAVEDAATAPEVEPEPTASSSARATQPPRNHCTCSVRVGSVTRPLCTKRLTPRCSCWDSGEPLPGPCPTGVPCYAEAKIETKISDRLVNRQPCAVQSGAPSDVSHRVGELYCEQCYGDRELVGPFVHGSACRGFDVFGDIGGGKWWCQGNPPPAF